MAQRKNERTVVVSLRLPVSVVEAIDRAAAAKGKTRSRHLTDRIVQTYTAPRVHQDRT